ncbi:MAG: hypothetical protein PVG51_18030 [Desulfosarcina sp.]|jgi:hypothetical protein
MKQPPKTIWFPAMTYGLGWGLPIKWQGWAVLLLVVLLMIVGGLTLSQPGWKIIVLPIYFFTATALFVWICWKKGARLDWRWGNKEDSS